MDGGIVIIGAGHAGSAIAAGLRIEGYEGRVTLLSAEEELPYHRPPLSKTFLKADGDQPLLLRPASFYDANRIDLRLQTSAREIDFRSSRVELMDGHSVPFGRLAIATGARARQIKADAVPLDGIEYLRTAADARRIRSRLLSVDRIVIVGGGFIGLELAATLSEMGVSIALIEMADRLIGRAVAPETSQHLLHWQQSWGVDLLLGEGLSRVVGADGRVVAVETTAGRRIDTQAVIIGIGASPNLDLARRAGIACGDGILVDEFMRAGDNRIVAAGDCVAFAHGARGQAIHVESVQNASDQARTAVKSLLGRQEPYRAVPWFWSDQRDIKLQIAGLAENSDRSIVRGDPAGGKFSVFRYRAAELSAIESINQPADHFVGRKLLAAGITLTSDQVKDLSFDLKTLLER
jgi:3-phenylpropionate/trans-cinnamate dioxygenase ferredoxin reductase component